VWVAVVSGNRVPKPLDVVDIFSLSLAVHRLNLSLLSVKI